MSQKYLQKEYLLNDLLNGVELCILRYLLLSI